MLIHSKFLIHWTGHDLHMQNSSLTHDIRDLYVKRLRSDCDQGFFMKKGPETNGMKISVNVL